MEVTVAQIKQRTLEQEKVEQLQKLKEAKEHNNLPPIGGKQAGALPSIGGRGGAFEIDTAYLKKAQAELDKLADFDTPSVPLKKDDRPMQEILKAKREQTQAAIEESKTQPSGQESIEQRKARLLAQRDLLREHKKK